MLQTRGRSSILPSSRRASLGPCRPKALPRDVQMQQHRLEEERTCIRRSKLQHSELRSRLLAIGIECDGLHDEDALVDALAEYLVLAKSQVIQFKLQRSSKRSNQRKSYLVVPVDVEGIGFVDFLIDSGTSSTLITGNLRSELGVSPAAGNFMTGLDSSGLTVRQKIRLPALRIGSRELDLKDAIVTNLDLNDSIGGVLGLSFLRQTEMDLNRAAGAVAFHPVGHADQGILNVSGMSKVRLYCVKGGLVITCVSLNGSSTIPAIVDLSANFSTINRPAAELAGLSSNTSSHLVASPFKSSKASSDIVFINPQALSISLGVPEAGVGKQAPSPEQDADAQGWEQLTCISNQPVLLRDMPSLAPLGFREDSPVIILGTDVILKERAVLALGTNTLYLYPS